jgi:4,5-DOPA dioxygenase extradiol
MDQLPALFVSHGAPDLPIRDGAVTEFLQGLHLHLICGVRCGR